MNKYFILKDEYELFIAKRKELFLKYYEEGKRKGEACEQSAETWHDNFPFEDAARSQEIIGKLIQEVDSILKNSIILTDIELANNSGKVQIGKRVTLFMNEKEVSYNIGGHKTLVDGRIAYDSPLAKALIGKEEGDIINTIIANKKIIIEILEIK